MSQPTVLVAEDDFIIACDLCDTVREAGFSVEGPHADVASAMRAFQTNRPDLAILDVHLGNEVVYPLAEKMIAENIPVIFHSGRITPDEVGSRFPGTQTLAKPCPPNQVIDTMTDALAA